MFSTIYVTERSGARVNLVVYSFPDWNRTTSVPNIGETGDIYVALQLTHTYNTDPEKA